ncbi:MAG TPA: isoaspartyl peptidase/L-asparaginase, partial [Chitinophagaceae bacterium]|nr:isoaspartyl peptidase/L-asparaginase [Chitinophagaceae bacterium]
VGEEVVRICGSHTIVEAMRYGKSPKEACKLAIERLIKIKGVEKAKTIQLGFIALSKEGEIGCYSMLPEFTMAIHNAEGPQIVNSEYFFEAEEK